MSALAAVVHALVLSQFARDLRLYRSRGCLQIQTTQPHSAEAADSKAVQSLSQQQTAWLKRLPKTPKALAVVFVRSTRDASLYWRFALPSASTPSNAKTTTTPSCFAHGVEDASQRFTRDQTFRPRGHP